MYTINRAAVVVRPRQPFVDWLNGHPDNDGQFTLLEDARKDATVYLIPDFEADKEAAAYVKELSQDIFEIELEAWHPNPDFWPKKRDFTAFQKWFEYEIHSLVIDPYENEIEKDEY